MRSPLSVVFITRETPTSDRHETTAALLVALLYYALGLDALAPLRRQPTSAYANCVANESNNVNIYIIYIYIYIYHLNYAYVSIAF